MSKKRILRITDIIVAVLLAFILIRLFKGPWISDNIVYHRFTWILLAPVIGLRNLSNPVVVIIGYLLLWIYIAWCKSILIRDRFTFIFAGFWAISGLLPFVFAGFSTFSLAVFGLQRMSPLVVLILYAFLISVYFLIFRYYFQQTIWLSAWWTILIILMIIILNTVISLSPQLVSQPFLNSLNYTTLCFLNIINRSPVFIFIIGVIIFWICLRYIRNNFLVAIKRHNYRFWTAPLIATIILVVCFFIINNDLSRYRRFNYRLGINTIYMRRLEDHVMIWCNNRHFGFNLNTIKLIYPFTLEPLADSIISHGKHFSRFTIIEGMDFFRFERILHILAYGPKDTLLYRTMKNLLRRGYYHPKSIETCIGDIKDRYINKVEDIVVKGSVTINGKPLFDTRYQVALFDRKSSLPVWMSKTDQDGYFNFNCYNPDSKKNYVNVHFILPDSILYGQIVSIELVDLPPPIAESGEYSLNTIQINIIKKEGEIKIFKVHVYAQSALTGFHFTLPPDYSMSTRINAISTKRGFLRDIGYYTLVSDSIAIASSKFRRLVSAWRFYTAESSENQIEVYLNYNRN